MIPRNRARTDRMHNEAHMDPKAHWEKVYRTKEPNEVSWYRPHLDVSLKLIEESAPEREARIIDVGGGESTLVDDLLARVTASCRCWIYPRPRLPLRGNG